MGMRGLPAAAPLEEGIRGSNHPSKGSLWEEHSDEEEGLDKLSPLPSWTSAHKPSVQV